MKRRGQIQEILRKRLRLDMGQGVWEREESRIMPQFRCGWQVASGVAHWEGDTGGGGGSVRGRQWARFGHVNLWHQFLLHLSMWLSKSCPLELTAELLLSVPHPLPHSCYNHKGSWFESVRKSWQICGGYCVRFSERNQMDFIWPPASWASWAGSPWTLGSALGHIRK